MGSLTNCSKFYLEYGQLRHNVIEIYKGMHNTLLHCHNLLPNIAGSFLGHPFGLHTLCSNKEIRF